MRPALKFTARLSPPASLKVGCLYSYKSMCSQTNALSCTEMWSRIPAKVYRIHLIQGFLLTIFTEVLTTNHLLHSDLLNQKAIHT